MALANFFDRAATAASQILGAFELGAFERLLADQVIALAVDGHAGASIEGVATAELCVNLLARLYPTLALVPLDPKAGELVRGLGRLARRINPDIAIKRTMKGVTAGIAVGKTRPSTRAPIFFAGSDGWVAKVSRREPVGSGASGNPFGAGAAACFATANVFRTVFADQLPRGDADDEISLSFLNFDRRSDSSGELGRVNIADTHLVGAGAIGNAVIWAFARTPKLSGTLHVVDHEAVDLSNLQRYVLAMQEHVGTPKVDMAVAAFGKTRGFEVIPHPVCWAEYVNRRQAAPLERVAVALDTAADRIAVQGALPKWIANAWTAETDLGVSRHGFVDGRACLACLYMPRGQVKDEDELIAEEIGLPGDRLQVRSLLQTNAPVDLALTVRIAAALGVAPKALSEFEGKPLRALHQRAMCGGLVSRLTGARRSQALVPMAFQSALAGIMLAGEVVKHAAGIALPTTSTRINLLRPLGAHLGDPWAKHPTCICQDPDYVEAFRRKFPAAA